MRRDSGGVTRAVPLPQPTDTAAPPLAHAAVPTALTSDGSLHFDRAQLFATGALTVEDLLTRMLIATPVALGYIAAPAHSAVAGDFRRTRVFIDGIEYDALDPRSNGLVDLSQIQLWSAEDVTIEQTAGEIRVHIRTWRVDRVSPYTRLDIGTGDQQLNLYRGFFGRRFDNGGAFQLAAQNYSTTPPSYLGTGADQLGVIGRVGWAGKRLSIDGFATHVSRHRGDIRTFGRADTLRGLESARTDAYLRVGWEDPDTSARWFQVVMSHGSDSFRPESTTTTPMGAVDTSHVDVDTTRTGQQYVASAGLNRGALHVAGFARLRLRDSLTLFTPSLSIREAFGPLAVRADVEGKSVDSLSRVSVAAEAPLLRSFHIGGAVDRASDHLVPNAPTDLSARGWAGVRVRDLWIDAGLLRRGKAALVAPKAFGDTSGLTVDEPVSGQTLRIHGRVYEALFADLMALRWSDTAAAVYRPKYQTRSELFVQTGLPDRFRNGEFNMLISVRHEYRSASLMPVPGSPDLLRAQGERAVSALVEFRVYSAVASWQIRNVLGTRNYEWPNYLAPRTTNFYGVRWEFWN